MGYPINGILRVARPAGAADGNATQAAFLEEYCVSHAFSHCQRNVRQAVIFGRAFAPPPLRSYDFHESSIPKGYP